MAKRSVDPVRAKRVDALTKCVKSCQETAGRLDALRACGVDCEREIRENAEQLRVAEKLLAHVQSQAE